MKSISEQSQEERDAHFMGLALDEAKAAAVNGQTPFGAVVVSRDGKVLGQGYNMVRADLDPAAHGEVVAIRQAWRSLGNWQMLEGATLYSSCEPCLLCSFVITQAGFTRVVFAARGTDVPGYRPLLEKDLLKASLWINTQADWTPLEVVGDFMREEALQIIAAFPVGTSTKQNDDKIHIVKCAKWRQKNENQDYNLINIHSYFRFGRIRFIKGC